MNNLKGFSDLGDLPENERINIIGKTLMAAPQSSADKPMIIGVVVDNETVARRYIRKIEKRFPRIKLIDHTPGPVLGTVLIRLGAPPP